VNIWEHLEACADAKYSREGTRSVGSLKKNLYGFAPRNILIGYFM